jgi:hypothetical protein
MSVEVSLGTVREQIPQLTQKTESFKKKIKQLQKTAQDLVAAGKLYADLERQLGSIIINFGQAADNRSQDYFLRLGDLYSEMGTRRYRLIEQQETLFNKPIKQFDDSMEEITDLGQKVEDSRKAYEISTEKLHSTKKKAGEAKFSKLEQEEKADKQLFETTGSDYVKLMKETLKYSNAAVIENLINCSLADLAFFQNGSKTIKEAEQFLQRFFAQQKLMRRDTIMGESVTTKNGYLLVKHKGKWKRRWVSIINGQLMYYKNWKSLDPIDTLNLVLCSVKPLMDSGKPSRFDLLSAEGKTVPLEAVDINDMHDWIRVIENIIIQQLGNEDKKVSSSLRNSTADINNVAGNKYCADCHGPDPQWASTTFGILVCIKCSGAHRNLGAHISKVRSLTLDHWEPEVTSIMQAIGNKKCNSLYEARAPDKKINPESSSDERLQFIKAKYLEKQFVIRDENVTKAAESYLLAEIPDPFDMYSLLAKGLSVNWQSSTGRTLLHNSSLKEDIVGVALLMMCGAQVNLTDADGNAPLHMAALYDSAGCARVLLQYGAKTDITNKRGLTPYQISIENLAANCKALLDPENDPEALNAFFTSEARKETEHVVADLRSYASEPNLLTRGLNSSPPQPTSRNPSKSELATPTLVASPKSVAAQTEKRRNRLSREVAVVDLREGPLQSSSAGNISSTSSPATPTERRSGHNRNKSAAFEARVALFQGKK